MTAGLDIGVAGDIGDAGCGNVSGLGMNLNREVPLPQRGGGN
jgi:hypothetical protein